MSEVREAAGTGVRSRVTALDGIRGVAIILVVLSHGWTLWPTDRIDSTPVVRELFSSGNLAVSVFFFVGGYLAMGGMLRDVERSGRPAPGEMAARVVRRAVRTGAHTYTLLAFVMFAAVLDVSEPFPDKMTRDSVWRVMTFTYNWAVGHHALELRPDLGHLWYLCVDLQVFVLLVLLVRMLGHRRLALLATLLGLILLVTWWRTYSVDHEALIDTTVRTTTRMDSMIWGAALATAVPYLTGAARYARRLVWVSLALLAAMLVTTGGGPDYFRADGVLINLGLALFVLGASFAPRTAPLSLLGSAPLQELGRMSLAIYVWHYPVFWAVSRWNAYWEWHLHWASMAMIGLTLTALAAYIAQRYVEEPLQRWLARSRR